MNRAWVASLVLSSAALAQNLQVIPVPWIAADATIPHFAYNGHATTFKAIARGPWSEYLAASAFSVKLPVAPEPMTAPSKCGCGTSGGGLALGGLLMLLSRRRRR